MNAGQVADVIRKGNWNEKNSIWLKSCNTGKDVNGFVRQLANELGVQRRSRLRKSWTIQRLLSYVPDPIVMNTNTLILFIILSAGLIACKKHATDGVFVIPQDKLEVVEREASDENISSIKKLIAHYDAIQGGEASAEMWRRKAISLGDSEELYFYAAKLLIQAKRESNEKQKMELLVPALDAAKRSYANNPDAATKRLIDEITLASQANGAKLTASPQLR